MKTLTTILILLNLLVPFSMFAAVAYDADSDNLGESTGGDTTQTWTHTPVGTPSAIIGCGEGSNGTNGDVASWTYAGAAMTEAVEKSSVNGYAALWRTTATPASGAQTTVITWTNSPAEDRAQGTTISVTGGSTLGATGVDATESGTAPSVTLSPTPASTSLLIDCLEVATDTSTTATSANGTKYIHNEFHGTAGIAVGATWASPTSGVMAYTLGTSRSYGLAAIEITVDAAGGAAAGESIMFMEF